jgi:hypothetical protein
MLRSRLPSPARVAPAAAFATAALLLAAAPAGAAPSCSRGGATILAASAKTRVVSIANRPKNAETRRDHILGCRVPTGKRFELFFSRSFGDDLIERDHFEIVGDRYIGFIRDFEGGVSESQTAAVFDSFTRRKTHDSAPCDSVDQGDFSGVEDAAFLPRGGLAYECGQLRLADAKGDRPLEPPGTDVRNLGVSANARGFNARLYWLVVTGATETPKSLDLGVF